MDCVKIRHFDFGSFRSRKNKSIRYKALFVLVFVLVTVIISDSYLRLSYKILHIQHRIIATIYIKPGMQEDKWMELCPIVPPDLSGDILPIDTSVLNSTSYKQIEDANTDLYPGGCWKPRECLARQKLAIVVPYRNRTSHLKVFLNHMHPFLKKQQLDYCIYIVDQALPTTFNRAMLMNIGFAAARRIADYTCFVFHDVDLLPQDERNMYTCLEHPTHMSEAISKWDYKVKYHNIFGGVTAFRTAEYKLLNGYSNKFFGWGGEDDNMLYRIQDNNLTVIRTPLDIARYKSFDHERDATNPVNPNRYTQLKNSKKTDKIDGLNSLHYDLLELSKTRLYTWVYVRVFENDTTT